MYNEKLEVSIYLQYTCRIAKNRKEFWANLGESKGSITEELREIRLGAVLELRKGTFNDFLPSQIPRTLYSNPSPRNILHIAFFQLIKFFKGLYNSLNSIAGNLN